MITRNIFDSDNESKCHYSTHPSNSSLQRQLKADLPLFIFEKKIRKSTFHPINPDCLTLFSTIQFDLPRLDRKFIDTTINQFKMLQCIMTRKIIPWITEFTATSINLKAAKEHKFHQLCQHKQTNLHCITFSTITKPLNF